MHTWLQVELQGADVTETKKLQEHFMHYIVDKVVLFLHLSAQSEGELRNYMSAMFTSHRCLNAVRHG